MADSIDAVERMVHAKIERQGGVPAFYDNRVLSLIESVRQMEAGAGAEGPAPAALGEIERYCGLTDGPRFTDPRVRLGRSGTEVRARMAPGFDALFASQGVTQVPTWAGRPLFKTAFDCVIYPMLIAELGPRTIVELGSGAGGSAVWMADVAEAHGLRPRIVSIDLKPVDVEDRRVEFRRGDLNDVSAVLPPRDLAAFDHPWLVIEDAHVNVARVLAHLDSGMTAGDCLIVEDSFGKRAELRDFVEASRNAYLLDRKYLDMFGENSTCALDSIFVAADR
jgi:cephalosporin hydroxylase